MSTSNRTMKWTLAALGLASLASLALPLLPQGVSAAAPGDPAFTQVWDRTDRPVESRMVARSWTWGPGAFDTRYEPYAEGPAGQHLVTYYDKARMEINDPSADRNAQWFVTNGLLVVDMIAGQVQTGDNSFTPAAPANIPVAGDAGASLNAPTYAGLRRVASLNGDHRATNRVGQAVREGLGRTGNPGTVDNLAGYARYAVYEPTTGHNIADVFWTFLNQKGTVYQNGQYSSGTLVNWLFAMGYPITEPYWIQINVSGQERWVLMQAFQRRILTYSPQNPQGWQVEMANVGRAYYDWRYSQTPAPTPTAIPTSTPRAAASISISPTRGDTNTTISVNGKGFPANAAVTIGVERRDASYSHNLAVLAAKSDGSFGAKITLPDDAAKLGAVTITATANGGAVRATATFTLNYSPSITTAPGEVVTNGVVNVRGDGFPARANIDLGAQFNGGDMQWLVRTKSDDNGSFEANVPIGARTAGSTFKVIAVSDGGFKATAKTTHSVLAQPALRVVPGSGPAGVNVTLVGNNWPANRPLTLGTRSINSPITAWLPNQVTADGNGNFSVPVYIAPEDGTNSEVRLIAFESISTFRMEASYRIVAAPTPSPTPAQVTVAVAPAVLAIGQTATVSGANWQSLAVVQVGIGRPGNGVEEWLGSARATGDGTFSLPFVLGQRWANAGQLVLTAVIPGGQIATTTISVVSTVGRITPSGLPMTVTTYSYGGVTQVKINANGWRPGSVVHLSVIAPDGSVNQEMATAVANANGIFGAAFDEVAPWAGRADLGIKATTIDGIQYSLRYLPVTTVVKQQGGNNTYLITGFNWPANSSVEVVLGSTGDVKGEGGVVRTITTGADGTFSFTLNVPRLPGNSKRDLELRTPTQPYSAAFDL